MDYFTLIKELANFIKNRNNKTDLINEKLYLMYVEEVYKNAKKVFDDYYQLFNQARNQLVLASKEENQIIYNKKINEVIQVLESKRIPLKSMRDEMKSVLINSNYYLEDINLQIFAIGILGLMVGGFSSIGFKTKEEMEIIYQVEDIKGVYKEIKMTDKIDVMMDYEKLHSFISKNPDIEKFFLINNDHTLMNILSNTELFVYSNSLTTVINKTIHSLELNWRLVCDSYVVIKENHFIK